MECRQCGAKLPFRGGFLPVCGTAVRGEAAEASAQDCAAVQEGNLEQAAAESARNRSPCSLVQWYLMASRRLSAQFLLWPGFPFLLLPAFRLIARPLVRISILIPTEAFRQRSGCWGSWPEFCPY